MGHFHGGGPSRPALRKHFIILEVNKMSDIMRPMPFAQLMDWALTEYKNQGSIFGVSKLVKHTHF